MPSVTRPRNQRHSASHGDLIDQLPDPLAVFDAEGRLRICNRSFRETFHVVTESQFVPRAGFETGMVSRVCPVISSATAAPTARAMAASAPASQGAWRSAQQGPWFAGEARHMPDGGTLLVYRNVTAYKAVEAELQRKLEDQAEALFAARADRQKAMDAAQARGDLLAITSHELRTPLNAILGFSEILVKEMFGPLANDRYREYAQIIHKSGSHLLDLINDLLDMSKLDAGKLALHFESVDVLKVIIDCVRRVETQAQKSHVGISVTLYDSIGYLRGDDKRLHQMLLNLLSNALKFTPEGGEIRVCAFRRGDSIAISVSDTGIGIKPDDLPKVLEPFGQIDSALGRKHEGTGLGLPLTKDLAELHGGSLFIESREDIGTTATILIPMEAGTASG
jgi:two-component system cell cycle sensor histidine kinase PleC